MQKAAVIPDEKREFAFLAEKTPVGYLGIITPDGYPRVVPFNFAVLDRLVYLHGAAHGETFEYMSRGEKVTFSIDLAYSSLPSFWTSKISACASSMLYRSALVKGRGSIVTEGAEKVRGLTRLMEKYQPEGGYQPIDAESRTYRNIFKATAVYCIKPDIITFRVSMRQKKSRPYNLALIKKLEERGHPIDLETAREIEKLYES